MTLILKAIWYTVLIILLAVFWLVVAIAVTHSWSLGVLAFWASIAPRVSWHC
jgi:hypothetical protein